MIIMVSKRRLHQALTEDRVTLGGNAIPLFPTALVAGVFVCWIFFFGNLWSIDFRNPETLSHLDVPPLSLTLAIGVVYLMGFWINRLKLDFSNRSYTKEDGVYPFLKHSHGQLADFDHLRLSREMRRGGHNDYYVWRLDMVRKDGSAPTAEAPCCGVYGSGDRLERAEMTRLAAKLAQRLGLPLQVEIDNP